MWRSIQDLSPLPSFSCTISNLICVPASFYRVVVGVNSALPLFPHHATKGVGCRGESSPPTRLLLVPARRGYRLFMNILFPNMVNIFSICVIAGFRREVVETFPLQICYVLLTVHLVIIFVNNQHEAQWFFMYVYSYFLHVSDSYVPIIRRINCINTTSGICHSVSMTFWYAGLHTRSSIWSFSKTLQGYYAA